MAERATGPLSLTRGSRGDAVRELLGRSFNHYRQPEASFRAVVAAVRESRVWRARYHEAHELAATLGDLCEVPTAADTAYSLRGLPPSNAAIGIDTS